MNYYKICFKEEEYLGVGKTIEKRELFFPPYNSMISDWKELLLELVDGDYPDYLASNFGGRVCSPRMREIFDNSATADDCLQWLDVKVSRGNEIRDYHYLHFPYPPNVLHPTKTIFAGKDVVVKPVLLQDAVASHAIFSYPKNGGLPLFINELVRKQIIKCKLTGLEISKMPVA